MDYSKYASKMRKVMEEAAHIKKSYDTIKENILEEYHVRKSVYTDLDERLKETLEALNRGEVSKNAYSKLKKDHERAEKIFYEVKSKLDEIDKFMNQRLDNVILQLSEIKEKYTKEVMEETTKLKYHILKAKRDFLTNAVKIRDSFGTLSSEENEFQELFQELGLQSELDTFKVLTESVRDDNGSVITVKELYNVMQTGKIPSQLEDELRYAQDQGFLS